VVQDASRFAHARRADDDAAAHRVERLALLDVADVRDAFEEQRVVALTQHLAGLGVEQVGVVAHDPRGFAAHRRVHPDRQLRQRALAHELAEEQHDRLRAADGEGRNDDAAAVVQLLGDDARELGHHVDALVVHAVAVGRLGDQRVALGDALGIAQDRQVLPAVVAGEHDAALARALLDVHHDDRRAEDVAGVEELDAQLRRDLELLPVRHRLDEAQRALDVGFVVQRLEVVAALAQVTGVLRLDVRGVHQHQPQHVGGRLGAPDRAVVAVLDQSRQGAAVVDVRVREHQRVDVAAGDRQVAVLLVGDLARALDHAAVEQDLVLADFEQVLGAGDVARGAEETQGEMARRAAHVRTVTVRDVAVSGSSSGNNSASTKLNRVSIA